jgi:hypothetical protein
MAFEYGRLIVPDRSGRVQNVHISDVKPCNKVIIIIIIIIIIIVVVVVVVVVVS